MHVVETRYEKAINVALMLDECSRIICVPLELAVQFTQNINLFYYSNRLRSALVSLPRMTETELHFRMALSFIEGVGPIIGKELIRHFVSAENLFLEPPKNLISLKRVGKILASERHRKEALDLAEKQFLWCVKNKVQILVPEQPEYPELLMNCEDAPLVLYHKGEGLAREPHSISIVGTRKCTDYGRGVVNSLLSSLAHLDVAIYSGLAYGIDYETHRQALKLGLPTYCALAHGFDRIYPSQHRKIAEAMLEKGGWISEFPIGTNPDRENFPKRNRIVAGISEATVVVESGKRGGSIITAQLANSYSRDVFAVPGRLGDTQSEGCNWLIKTNQAHLVNDGADLCKALGWQSEKPVATPRKPLDSMQLNTDERTILTYLRGKRQAGVDEIAQACSMAQGELAGQLLTLQLRGLLKQLPGKIFSAIG